MNWKQGADLFVNTLFPSVTAFIGAGLSKPSGLPDWNQLIEPYAKDLGVKDTDLSQTRIMQYALGGKPSKYAQFRLELKKAIRKAKLNHTHRLVARLHLSRIWTTNYDSLLEDAYEEEGMISDVIARDDDMHRLTYERPQIIKMHGSLTDKYETDIVLLESEYESYERNRKSILDLLATDIRTKSFLYIGISYDDPNVRKIFSAIWGAEEFGKPSILLTVPPPKSQRKNRKLFNLWEEDLTRYGVNVVSLKTYEEIDLFIYRILQQSKGKSVTILGKYNSDSHKDFCTLLGKRLAEQGFRICSGGGPNVAVFVAEGAWRKHDALGNVNQNLVEFYYRESGGSTNPKKGRITYVGADYAEMRNKMIVPENVCIVIGEEGNRETGISQEVAIARRKGARIIPVAVTGSTANRVWQEDLHYFSGNGCFSGMSDIYNALNDSNINHKELVDKIIKLADYLLVRSYT